MAAQDLIVKRIEVSTALEVLADMQKLDPTGMMQAGGIAGMIEACQCFAVEVEGGGQAVYAVKVTNGIAWVNAARGHGRIDWSQILLDVIPEQARGCESVRFQTGRPGLVKKAKKQGYEVVGWILKKELEK